MVPHFNTLFHDPSLPASLRSHIPGFTPNLGRCSPTPKKEASPIVAGPSVKLQHNTGGGGCFPLHCDSDAALDARVLTCLVYLNPLWRPSHGGQLRLYPFAGRPVDVEPINDRMVLFWSQVPA